MALIGSIELFDYDNVYIAYDGSNPSTITMYKENKLVKQIDLTYIGDQVSNILIDYQNGKVESLGLTYETGNVNQITKEVI